MNIQKKILCILVLHVFYLNKALFKYLCIFHKKKKKYIYENMFIIKQTNSISNMKTSDHYHPDLIDFNSLLDRLLFLSSNSNILLLTSLSSVSCLSVIIP